MFHLLLKVLLDIWDEKKMTNIDYANPESNKKVGGGKGHIVFKCNYAQLGSQFKQWNQPHS